MAAQMRQRFRDLPDVDWDSFEDGEVATYDETTDTLTGEAGGAGGGAPTGAAGGVLGGTYPDPGFAVDMATQAELNTSTAAAVPKALVDAKGDLIVATAADTVARRPVGSDGQVFTADSVEADGVKWAAPSGGPPTGPAGGVLTDTYPNPGFAVDLATQEELDAVAASIGEPDNAVVLEPAVSDRNVVEGSANVTLLRLKAHPDQTVPLQEWRNSGDDDIATVVMDADSSGHINVVGDNPWVELTGTGDGVTGPTVQAHVPDVSGTYMYGGSVYCYAPDAVADYAVLFTQAWSDADARFKVLADGSVLLGNGTDAPDTTLERTAAGELSVNGEAVVLDDDARLVGGVDQGDIDTTVATHSADTTSVHGITDTTVLATDTEVATAVSDHSADTTAVHGIADTSALASLPIAEANVTGLTAALAAKQPLDSDLTALAALSTTSYGRSLLELADAAGHAASHADGGSAEITTALDPLSYPSVLKPDRAYVTGQYYPACITAQGGLGGAGAQTVNKAIYTLFIVYTQTTFDRIGVYITVNASAGGLYRLGIYNDNAGVPGTVLLDAGTVATDAGAAAIKAITISQALAPGRYWACSVAQTAAATVRRTIQMTWGSYMTTDWINGTYNTDNVSGALGNNPTIAASSLNPPMVGLRAA